MACQAVFFPLRIMWIKPLVFFHYRPRDVEQLPRRGTAGHFLWLASLTQTGIEGFDDRVMLRRTSGGHIKGGPQAAVSRMPNSRPIPHTRSRLPGHGCQPSIGRQRVHGITTRQVERGHQRPRRRDPSDAFDTLEARRGSGPRSILGIVSG